MQTGTIAAARFALLVDGVEIATFSELIGITSEVDQTDYLAYGDTDIIFKKLPGKTKPPQMRLGRGKDADTSIWSWHDRSRIGKIVDARLSCALAMFSADGSPLASYWLENAWPCKLEVSALKAGATEVVYEAVTLVCESIQRL